jgi:hypothetical protein
MSAFGWVFLIGAAAVLGLGSGTDGTTAPQTVQTLADGTLNFGTPGTPSHGLGRALWIFAFLVVSFSTSVLIRSDAWGGERKGEHGAWVGGSLVQSFLRHTVEAAVWMAATVVVWWVGRLFGVAHAGVLVALLPILAFFTSPTAFLLACGTLLGVHAGLDGWAGMAAVPLTTPLLPAFVAITWLTFTAADPQDRFAHWWPMRRDVVGPLLGMAWRRMDAQAFDAALDDAVVEARGLWHAEGKILASPTEVVVRRQGTGVHVVCGQTDGGPNVARCTARALGRRIAGRLPPQGTHRTRTLAPDSAHAQLAVAARHHMATTS